MSDLKDFLVIIGIEEDTDHPPDSTEEENANYLISGERILSLARQKRKRVLFKTNNLTVRLCDLNYPRLEYDINRAEQQITRTMRKTIKEHLKEIKSKECLIEKGIPFLLSYCEEEMKDLVVPLYSCYDASLTKEVTGSEMIIKMKIGNKLFFIPVSSNKRFSNTRYYYKINPSYMINICHPEDAFSYLFYIHWLNQIKREAFHDDSIDRTIKYLSRELSPVLQHFIWYKQSLPEWFCNYLIDSGYNLDEKENWYIKQNMRTTAAKVTFMQMTSYADLFIIIAYAYGNKFFCVEDILMDDGENQYLGLPGYVQQYALSSLRYFIANLQNIRAEEKYRKHIEGQVARAYTTKRNIPQYIVSKMKTSVLNEYFGFIEFDEDVDIALVDKVTEEFKKLNQRYFNGFKCKNVYLRLRKLGRHHAVGLYFPTLNTMAVDFRFPDSFVHEYYHMIDDQLGDLSLQCEFAHIVERYQYLLRKTVREEKQKGNILLPTRGKYNINYYLQKAEIFARCGEIHLFRNLNVVSSLLKPEEKSYFAYPDDSQLNELINEYYTELLTKLGTSEITIRRVDYEENLHIAAQ